MGDHMNYVMTLANSIIGVGVLAMPFCFQKCGIALAILMILLSSVISRLSCHFLLKASIHARRKNFEFLAFHALGSTGKLLVELGIIGFLMGTVIAFFVVVGDLGPEIIAKIFNIESSQSLRSWLLIFITIGCVLPLGLLRNVDSLTSICTVTIGFYVCLVIKVMLESTKHISNSDWMDKVEIWKPSGILQCLPIFSMALFCQTQIFEIYSSMENASLEKMNLVIKYAINICAVVYILVGSFGYIAFCHQHFGGNILLSFSPTPMSDIIKMGFVLSVAFSFPLAIFPCRASLYSLLFRRVTSQHEVPVAMPERRFRCLTVLIVTVGLAVAMALPCIELVLGLVGSTMGVAVCVLLPAACYVKVVTRQNNERLLAQIVLIIGILIMVFGTYANLYAMDEATSNINIEKIVEDQQLLQNDFPKLVNDKTLMEPLEDTKLKLAVDKMENEAVMLASDNRHVKDDKERANNKVQEVQKDTLIESPPLPVEKDELVEVVDIVKLKEPSLEFKKKNDNKIIVKSKIGEMPKAQEGVKQQKNELPQTSKIINKAQESNLVEISKDAINKEDDELGLDKSSGPIKNILQNSVENEKSSQNLTINDNFNKNKMDNLKVKDSIIEEKVIQDIKKEKMQLDKEFQRKVVENVNLIASMNNKRIPNTKADDVNSIAENAINKNVKISQKLNKDTIEVANGEIKSGNLSKLQKENNKQKIDVPKSIKKENEIVRPKENKDTDNEKLNFKPHIEKLESKEILNDKPGNDLTVKKPILPIILLRNYTKNISNDDVKKEDKFLQREILEVATEKTVTTKQTEDLRQGAKMEKIVQDKPIKVEQMAIGRLKRDTEHEIHLSESNENCIKPETIILNKESAPKITLNNNLLDNPVVDIKNHEFSDILKPSSRDLKSIPNNIDENSH